MNTDVPTDVRSKIITTIARRLANDRKGSTLAIMREQAAPALIWLCQCQSEANSYVESLGAGQFSALLGACALAAVQKSESMVYRAAPVTIDGEVTYPAFIDGRLWNGHDMPLFELGEAFAVVNKACAPDSDLSYAYDPATGEFALTDAQYPDEPYTFAPERFTDATGISRLGWGIGAGYWTWSEADYE